MSDAEVLADENVAVLVINGLKMAGGDVRADHLIKRFEAQRKQAPPK